MLFDMACFTQSVGAVTQEHLNVWIVNVVAGGAFDPLVVEFNPVIKTVRAVGLSEVEVCRA